MEEVQRNENTKVAETPAAVTPVQDDAGPSSRQSPAGGINDEGVPQGGWRRQEAICSTICSTFSTPLMLEPESLRRLSEAMEGWKNKQQEIHRKFMEEFDNLGRDLSQMQHDTVNFKSEIDVVKDGLQRRASADRTHRVRTSVLAASSGSFKDVPKPNDVQK